MELFTSVTKNSDGNPSVAGYTSSNNGDIMNFHGGTDGLLLFTLPLSGMTNTAVTFQSGTFSLSNLLTSANFGNVTIDGTVKTLPFQLSDMQITDDRGTLDGWNLTVSATPFMETGGAGKTLGANNLVLNSIQSISQISGNSVLPSIMNESVVIDNGTVKMVSAAANTGSGTFDVSFPTDSLKLYVDTSKAIIDTASTIYQSIVTWTLNVGP